MDGGDVQLVDEGNDVARVRLTGAWGGCPTSQMPVKQDMESHTRKKEIGIGLKKRREKS